VDEENAGGKNMKYDIRIYLLLLFLGLATEDKIFFCIASSMVLVEIALDLLVWWRRKE
jgi:hypothetical protein